MAASVQRPDPFGPPCEHLKAESTGSTQASRLPDGRWQYRTAKRCLVCGVNFTEMITRSHDTGEVDVKRRTAIQGKKRAPEPQGPPTVKAGDVIRVHVPELPGLWHVVDVVTDPRGRYFLRIAQQVGRTMAERTISPRGFQVVNSKEDSE